MSPAAPPALQAKRLTKAYTDLVALAPLDLTVKAGERVVLVGSNGSGKTTFLRMAAGLLDPTDGEVLVSGHAAGSIEARAACCYLPDQPVLYDDLSVAEHLAYTARLYGAEGWETRGVSLIERFGLAGRADDLPSRFSRGLRQKTSLVLGLVRPFDVLLVDEPFVGLDGPGKATLLETLDEVAAEGATVLVATHALEFADRATRCIALRDGEVIHDGPATPAEVERLIGT